MRLYEVVYIFDPTLGEDEIDEKLDRYLDLAVGSDGEVKAVDHWGARQLAYPIEGNGTGYYVVAQFTADPADLAEFERVLKLDDQLLRYLLVLNEGEPTTGMSILSERPPRELEDEEEEDEEEEDDEDEDEDEDEDDDDDTPPEFAGGRGRRRRHDGPSIVLLNYKDVETLSRFLTEQGKILPRRTTKVNAPFQRQLGKAVKRARYLGLIPYIRDHEA